MSGLETLLHIPCSLVESSLWRKSSSVITEDSCGTGIFSTFLFIFCSFFVVGHRTRWRSSWIDWAGCLSFVSIFFVSVRSKARQAWSKAAAAGPLSARPYNLPFAKGFCNFRHRSLFISTSQRNLRNKTSIRRWLISIKKFSSNSNRILLFIFCWGAN